MPRLEEFSSLVPSRDHAVRKAVRFAIPGAGPSLDAAIRLMPLVQLFSLPEAQAQNPTHHAVDAKARCPRLPCHLLLSPVDEGPSE